MKIDGNSKKLSTSNKTGNEGAKISNTSNTQFRNNLAAYEKATIEEKMQMLADSIFAQGERLGKKIDVFELKNYKKLISEFLSQAVSNSHKFSRESFLDKRGRHKVYASIKKINSNIEELTKNVLNTEQGNLNILNKLEDIRGLILDLIL